VPSRRSSASLLRTPNKPPSNEKACGAGLLHRGPRGGGSTFLFDKIKGGAGIGINHCNRAVLSNFNLDWDWKVDPLASVGRVTAIAPNSSFFEMRFETTAPLDSKRWLTMNPLDEKLRAPGTGEEFSGFAASFKNLVISNNTFINREKAPISVKMGGSIRAELGGGPMLKDYVKSGKLNPRRSWHPSL
jgi:hypothetical protein